jgi:hypothetical protein
VGAAILLALLHRVPFAALRGGLAQGPWGWLVGYTLPFIVLTLVADAYATGVCLRIAGEPRPFGTLTLVRGATYLLGLLNYALGQGGIGLYLHRTGVRAARGTGIVLFLLIVNFGALAASAAAGVLGLALGDGRQGGRLPGGLLGIAVGILATGVAYLGVVALRPAFLARREVLAPLFAAGPLGHLAALAGRMPHLLLLILGHWGALWLWGVRVPPGEALARMPVVLLASVVPLSPSGLGTVQAAQVLLFAPYATEAAVLSFSIAFSLLGLASQALVGGVSLAVLRRREGGNPE